MNQPLDELIQARHKVHGEFSEYARLACALKRAFRENTTSNVQESEECCEALGMIFSKLARIGTGDPFEVDHWRDIAGYARIIENKLSKRPYASEVLSPKTPARLGEIYGDKDI